MNRMTKPLSPRPLLVFDLDGTLADTAGDLVSTLNALLTREGLAAIPFQDARAMVGAGAKARPCRSLLRLPLFRRRPPGFLLGGSARPDFVCAGRMVRRRDRRFLASADAARRLESAANLHPLTMAARPLTCRVCRSRRDATALSYP